MKWTVADAFDEFTKKFEGDTNWMYLDVKGYVTTGIGNLIDSVGEAQALPWRHADGSLANAGEVADAWHTVKNRQDMAPRGGGAFKGLTAIRLDPKGLRTLIASKLAENEKVLKARFPAFEAFPADAQMALLSMAWAAGPHFRSPKLDKALNQLYPDFSVAAAESHLADAGNPGLVPRNEANRSLFENAARALKHGYDVGMLHYPEILPDIKKAGIGIGSAIAFGAIGYGIYRAVKG